MITIALINQKGGVGKTTTTMNFGAALAESGRRVLLIDLDPQANLSAHAGVDAAEGELTVYDLLAADTPIAALIRPTAESNLFCIPANLDLAAAELELVAKVGRETLLQDAVKTFAKTADPPFDFILIDCPPSLGVLSINALAAADFVLVPMQTEFFALQGMARLLDVIQLVKRYLNPSVTLGGIIPCRTDKRPKLTQEVLDEIKTHFPDQLFATCIRSNVKLAEAPSHGKSVIAYAPDSNGAEDYRELVREFDRRQAALKGPAIGVGPGEAAPSGTAAPARAPASSGDAPDVPAPKTPAARRNARATGA